MVVAYARNWCSAANQNTGKIPLVIVTKLIA